jgi:hypothetical protein
MLKLVAFGALAVLLVRPARGEEIAAGETLDKTTWQKAEGLLPPEILAHYRDGGYSNAIVDWPADKNDMGTDFEAGSRANEGRFTTSPAGTILDKATGQQPPYIIGHPFPSIDAADPHAGAKVLWNHFYRTWYFGNLHAESQLNWMSPTAIERRADVDVYYAYYDGIPADEKFGSNPQNFLYRNLSRVVGPADLHGTAALTWRYRDGKKRDLSWAYVPALRRVRATSPANRSDGFLGSDESQDDGPFFDGKVEDFEWKLAGEADQLRLSEKTNLAGKATARWIDGKGWDTDWPDLPYIGYMDRGWKGLAWAPTAAATLSRRRFWIVEGTPRDKYYLFGKLQLYIDKINYQGAWNRKFGWRDELLAIHQVMSWNPVPFTRPDGKVDYLQGGNQAYQCIENVKLNRATVAGIKSSPRAGFITRQKFDEGLFAMDALARGGK